jgi:hypothetical protein
MALCLLFLGRKLFWLFVGIVGFALGVDFSLAVLGPFNSMPLFGGALLFGLLGAMLAVFLQRFAIILAGFIGGGYFAYHLALLLKFPETVGLLLFVIGAILGVILFHFVFDWALIVLSSLIGAIMIAQVLSLGGNLSGIIFILCAILGFFIQTRIFLSGDGKGLKKESSK